MAPANPTSFHSNWLPYHLNFRCVALAYQSTVSIAWQELPRPESFGSAGAKTAANIRFESRRLDDAPSDDYD